VEKRTGAHRRHLPADTASHGHDFGKALFIEEPVALAEYCKRHSSAGLLAFDTEFVRERTYFPRLEVFQIIADGEVAIIDCQAVEDLGPLWDLLCNEQAEKVVHSGGQDMEIILQEAGRLPRPIFDTQIAASLLGLGSQCGYGRLVYTILGKKVPKGETFSDWSHRPLHPGQIHYAIADVEHLPTLKVALEKRLTALEREGWVHEECQHLSEPETFRKYSPETCFLRIKGRSGLDRGGLSVLRSLARWRDLTARTRNHPPSRVIGDHVLLSLAKSTPECLDELRRQRGLHANEVNRCGEDILAAVREGQERAETDPVEFSAGRRPVTEEEDDGLFKVLSAVLQIEAEQAQIAPTMLATSSDLRELVSGFRQNRLNGIALLKGWRRDLAGEKLLKVLEGKIALRVDPKRQTLVLEEVDG
jgi:ribonuclease D